MVTIPPPEIFVSDAARVFCDGDDRGGDSRFAAGGDSRSVAGGDSRFAAGGDSRSVAGGDGHPRVWLQIGAQGFADCGYCDRRFVLAGGPADRR